MMISWKSFGVSMIGPGHIKNGIQNQDAFMEKHSNHFDCIVVSDGVGSCVKSDRGSQVACRAVIGTISDITIDDQAFPIEFFVEKIKERFLAGIAPFDSKECSATCLWAISVSGKIVLGMLGDGLVACVKKDGSVVLLSDDKTEGFSNLVSALSDRTVYKNWKYMELPEDQCKAILLCTDGISDDLDNVEGFICGFLESCLDNARETNIRNTREMLFNWPVPKHSDDKTIACMYHSEVYDE